MGTNTVAPYLETKKIIGSSEHLPSIPAVASQLLAIEDWESVEMQIVARIVGQDVSLSSKILRTVNSPFYGFSSEIGTISQALVILGLRATRSLALSFSLLKMVPEGATDHFDYTGFWIKSLNTAVVARELALITGLRSEEEAFLAGLIQNIGIMVLNHFDPQMYEPISEKLSNEDVDLIELEREVLGTDHVEVANLLFEDWNLPASLRIPVLYHHTPEKTEKTDEQIHLSIRVQYISGIVGELLYASDSESRSLDGAKETAFESLGISHDELEALMYRVDTQMDEISGALEIGASRPNTYSNLLEEAHIALGNIVGEQERLLRELEAAKLESQKLAEQLRVANNKLLGEARTDSLTGLANRRQLGEFLRQELDRSSRYSHSLSLLFVDIDNFKSINDQYGHLEGDAALRSLAGVLTRAVRTSDLVTRFGGEEFVIALVETDREDAMPIAERVRRSVEESSICRDREGRGIHLTVSVGVATYEAKAKKSKAEILLRDADQAMYHAKTIGKNRSVHIDDCIR